jgi:DNA-binding LacI/PurR family transcriptional regulator
LCDKAKITELTLGWKSDTTGRERVFMAIIQLALTTLRIDFGEMMGRMTFSLIDQIESPAERFMKFTVDMQLVIRDSCRSV